ncbi:MAG: response regulator [Planctomycetota bacterium]
MLVLTRRQNQKILFPALGITVEIIGVRGRNVKLGVDAPDSVRIVRDELFASEANVSSEKTANQNSEIRDNSQHQINNRLNSLGLRLQLAEKLIARGDTDRGRKEIKSVLDTLSNMESSHSVKKTSPEPKSTHIQPELSSPQVTVLLVEDNANERHLLTTILKMASVAVKSVANGEEALKYLESNPTPDLVLIDMEMPYLNGPQTISILRNDSKYADLPIYGVSGSRRSELNIPLDEKGVNGWFCKPVHAEKLLDKILGDCGISHQQLVG